MKVQIKNYNKMKIKFNFNFWGLLYCILSVMCALLVFVVSKYVFGYFIPNHIAVEILSWIVVILVFKKITITKNGFTIE